MLAEDIRHPEKQPIVFEGRSSSNASIYTETKHHSKANKLQSKTYHAILQQHGNIALSFNIQAAQSHSKLTDIS